MTKEMTPKEYEEWLKQQTEKTTEKTEFKNCQNCGKPMPSGLKFCSKQCVDAFKSGIEGPKSLDVSETVEDIMRRDRKEAKEAKFKEVCPESTKVLEDIKAVPMLNEKPKNNSVFFMSGDGMIRRDGNIEVVKNLIISGLNYEKIFRIARRKFTARTFNEYYNIALDEINNP